MRTAQEIITELLRRETRLARIQDRVKEGDSTQRVRDAPKGVQKGRHGKLAFHFKHVIIIALVTQEASIISRRPNSEKGSGLTPVCVISKFHLHFTELGYDPGKKRKPPFNLTFFFFFRKIVEIKMLKLQTAAPPPFFLTGPEEIKPGVLPHSLLAL